MRYDWLHQPEGAQSMANSTPPSGSSKGNPSQPQEAGAQATSWDVELLRVLVSRKGAEVEAQWAIHPQLKQDLLPHEWQEVTDLMGKVSSIVGTRFSRVLSQADSEPQSHA
jgi:hypothetical protein